MKSTGQINVMFAASTVGTIVGGFAVLFAPFLAFFYLVASNPPIDGGTEYGMILAVVSPLCCATAGFILGALMAYIVNMLAEPSFQPQVVKEKTMKIHAGSVIDAA